MVVFEIKCYFCWLTSMSIGYINIMFLYEILMMKKQCFLICNIFTLREKLKVIYWKNFKMEMYTTLL